MRPHPFGISFDKLRTNGWGRGPPTQSELSYGT